MLRKTFTLLGLLVCGLVQAQNSEEFFLVVEEMPQPKRGMPHFYQHLIDNLQIPKGFEGDVKIYVQFIVEKDGQLSNFHFLKNPDEGLAASALRALQSYPEPWQAGKQAGQPVRVKYTLPIAFKVDAAPAEPTQAVPEKPEEKETFLVVETPPQPKEGFEDFYKYLASQLRYPTEARRMGKEGRVFVQFVVEENGQLSDFKILKTFDEACGEEALRVLGAYPHLWEPGQQFGKAVRVQMTLPVVFKLSGEKNNLAMIVIDQVQYNGEALDELLARQKLEVENIREIQVLKGDEAVARFGEAARSGVVLIFTNKAEAAPATEKPALAFYPNPAREMMNLRFTLKEAAPVRITAQEMQTASREVVLEKHFEAGEHLFGWVVAPLAPGWYILEMEIGKEKYFHKVLIEK
ncbi:MAG: hypothetical protein OHK0053_36260 [Microscillaceae bacterium]